MWEKQTFLSHIVFVRVFYHNNREGDPNRKLLEKWVYSASFLPVASACIPISPPSTHPSTLYPSSHPPITYLVIHWPIGFIFKRNIWDTFPLCLPISEEPTHKTNIYSVARISMCVSPPHTSPCVLVLFSFSAHSQHPLLLLDFVHGCASSFPEYGLKLKSDCLGMNFSFQIHTYWSLNLGHILSTLCLCPFNHSGNHNATGVRTVMGLRCENVGWKFMTGCLS